MSLRNQRRLAAKIMDVGENRVWIDPERTESVEGVITRVEIGKLVHEGVIKARAETGVSRGRAQAMKEKKSRGLKRGVGSRKGKKTARTPGKETWENRIRSIRSELRNLKERRVIAKDVYRDLYLKAKGGAFEDTSRVEQYIDAHRLGRRR